MANSSCLYPQFDREISMSNYAYEIIYGVTVSGSMFLKQTSATQAVQITGIMQVNSASSLNDIVDSTTSNAIIFEIEGIFDETSDVGVWSCGDTFTAPIIDVISHRIIGHLSMLFNSVYNSNKIEVRASAIELIGQQDPEGIFQVPLVGSITILNQRY